MRAPAAVRQWRKRQALRQLIASTLYRSKLAPWKHRVERVMAWLLESRGYTLRDFAKPPVVNSEADYVILALYAWARSSRSRLTGPTSPWSYITTTVSAVA